MLNVNCALAKENRHGFHPTSPSYAEAGELTPIEKTSVKIRGL
jgi:hypothetical protein